MYANVIRLTGFVKDKWGDLENPVSSAGRPPHLFYLRTIFILIMIFIAFSLLIFIYAWRKRDSKFLDPGGVSWEILVSLG